MKLFLFSLLFTAASTCSALADSPLTSTDFAAAYKNEKMVKAANAANGVLTPKLMKFLAGSGKIDVKMAVINALGWNIDGKINAVTFLKYIKDKQGFSSDDEVLNNASPDIVLCVAYLKAMDNYFDVEEAAIWSKRAALANRSSYTFAIIDGLIQGQFYFDTNWCDVFYATDNVRTNTALTKDMNEAAITIIFEYMDLYADSCAEE